MPPPRSLLEIVPRAPTRAATAALVPTTATSAVAHVCADDESSRGEDDATDWGVDRSLACDVRAGRL